MISFYSFEGVRYYWVELCIFFYTLPSATNQQLFCVTKQPLYELLPSVLCLHWALVKCQWPAEESTKNIGNRFYLDILTSDKNVAFFSNFIFPTLIDIPNNLEINALISLVVTGMFLLPKSASLMSLVRFPENPL